jgi:hypothetical protein
VITETFLKEIRKVVLMMATANWFRRLLNNNSFSILSCKNRYPSCLLERDSQNDIKNRFKLWQNISARTKRTNFYLKIFLKEFLSFLVRLLRKETAG